MNNQIHCPVCGSSCFPLDVVDFNKSCEEVNGSFLCLSEIPIYYYLCTGCQFCYAPEFTQWELSDFEERIYNTDYILVDPDYLVVRPQINAKNLLTMLGVHGHKIRHLDYGGGNGLLSNILKEAGWQSTSFDPFVDKCLDPTTLGRFDLITAFEVFEHVPDVCDLIKKISVLLEPDGIVLFSTLVSDGNIAPCQRVNWWYASPRNGHISLFSRKSLTILGSQKGYNFASFYDGFHVFFKNIPFWASHLIRGG